MELNGAQITVVELKSGVNLSKNKIKSKQASGHHVIGWKMNKCNIVLLSQKTYHILSKILHNALSHPILLIEPLLGCEIGPVGS